MASNNQSRYDALIAEIFKNHYGKGKQVLPFSREEIETTARTLKLKLPKNLGDVLYSFRFRKDLPPSILDTAPEGMEWVIELAGHGRYRFRLCKINRIEPCKNRIQIKIPDSTPEIISTYALTDEQALLAKVRYNRLIDIFLGITAYSLQNHLRTTVKKIGQIEVDEIYVGVNRQGMQFVVPVQAKGGNDQIGAVQTAQDIACCKEKFPHLVCRAVSVQFLDGNAIAMFELDFNRNEIQVLDERHYRLVPGKEVTRDDLDRYAKTGRD